jgi:hypothetical protein
LLNKLSDDHGQMQKIDRLFDEEAEKEGQRLCPPEPRPK